MRKFFGYIRVSTARQGEHGVSLQEQREAIERHAERNALEIAAWFEERETAAKRGRPIFAQMLKLLRRGKADGVIIHKIDRSARNLKDWADLGELIDAGIDVRFANESLDLHTRGGRLSADIQAVVAADYIRNLKEETRKGFYGRIKQGLYPLPAPLGYVDKGKGKLKELEPTKAPLVRKAFELYGTGRYTLHSLQEEMFKLGLRNRRGGKVSINGLSVLLNNPFYIGLIHLNRTDETFPGSHEPLISKSLFDRVQQILTGRVNVRTQHHDFLFRSLLHCGGCKYRLTGELQKGHIYYRCHTKDCRATCTREQPVEEAIFEHLSRLQFTAKEREHLKREIVRIKKDWVKEQESFAESATLRLARLQERLTRLTDAYIDRLIEKDVFEQRKALLLMERKSLEEAYSGNKLRSVPAQVEEFFELAGDAYLRYKLGEPEEKRVLLKIATSNRIICGKEVHITLSQPFAEVANRFQTSNSSPYRDELRTLSSMLEKVLTFFKHNPTSTWKMELSTDEA
ncbi:MAG: recombinase family protein [Acidobacteriota bacterium]|nr:recombinase family protein [Acidobacteriota bacterium]